MLNYVQMLQIIINSSFLLQEQRKNKFAYGKLCFDSNLVIIKGFVNNNQVMIRVNLPSNGNKIVELYYRNAFYQGEMSNNHFQGSGIVYFHEEGHLIACNHFQNGRIDGPAFFVYDPLHYHFGQWHDNSPSGLSTFRIRDMLIVAQYINGIILEGSRAFILLEAHNLGVIAQVKFGDSWWIRQKSEVYCLEHVQSLISKCKFNSIKQIEFSLFKFLSHRFNNPPFKLKIINNDDYWFGIQEGLSLRFDNSYQIIGKRSKICKSQEKPQQMSPIKVGQVYNSSLLATDEFNFRNKTLKDPSRPYFDQLSNILNPIMIKTMLSGFIKDNSNVSLTKSRKLLGNNQEISVRIEKTESKQNTSKMLETSEFIHEPKKINKTLQSYQQPSIYEVEQPKESQKNVNLSQQKQRPNYTQIGSSFVKSKFVRQPIKLFSFRESPTKNQPNTKASQFEPITHQQQDISTHHKKQQVATYQKYMQRVQINESQSYHQRQQQKQIQSPERIQSPSRIKQTSKTNKSKRKIFTQYSAQNQSKQFSPDATNKQFSQSRSRHKIFNTPKQAKLEASIIDYAKSQSSIIKERSASPILSLKSEALRTQKGKDQGIQTQQPHLYQKTQTQKQIANTSEMKREFEEKKHALTQFEVESDIVSQDMSNLVNLKANRTGHGHVIESSSKKVKKHNQIYRDDRKQSQKQLQKGKYYDNSPYLAQLNSKNEFIRSPPTPACTLSATKQRSVHDKKYYYL